MITYYEIAIFNQIKINIMDNVDIQYRIPKNDDVPFINKDLSYSFACDEPMGKILELKSSDLEEFFLPIVNSSLKYSCIAYDKANGKLAGGIVCNDFNFFKEYNPLATINNKLIPIMTILSELEHNFINSNFYNLEQKNFYQFATYVHPDYRGLGIAYQLYQFSEKHAFNLGFDQIVTISTGPVSQHIRSKKLNFQEVSSINYEDFLFEGKAVFKNIDNKSCIFFVKSRINQ